MTRFLGGKVYGTQKKKNVVVVDVKKQQQQQAPKQVKIVKATVFQKPQQKTQEQAPEQVKIVKATVFEKPAATGQLIRRWAELEQRAKKNQKVNKAIQTIRTDVSKVLKDEIKRQEVGKIFQQITKINKNIAQGKAQLKAIDEYVALKQQDRTIKATLDRLKFANIKKIIGKFEKLEKEFAGLLLAPAA